MEEIDMKMPLTATTAEAVPITSIVVILVKINQNTYPENSPIIISTKKNLAPEPTSALLNSYHHN